MSIVIPDRSVQFPGDDYGLKVIDPTDKSDIFNAKYPIFGSDITNTQPQIITHKITVTNSSGLFNEPATPSIPYVGDNQWYQMMYNQANNYTMATIPHGQGKEPQFMITGTAHIRHTGRLRYYMASWGGPASYNSVYLPSTPSGGYWEYTIPPRLGGAETMLPTFSSGAGGNTFTYTGVGPYTDPVTYWPPATSLTITADSTNIYIKMSIPHCINYQRYNGGSFGWDRYEKYWTDLSGSWYQFTFYILPYTKTNDIYIR